MLNEYKESRRQSSLFPQNHSAGSYFAMFLFAGFYCMFHIYFLLAFDGLRSRFLIVIRQEICQERSPDCYNFHMEITNLEEDLKATNEFLASERELNKRLWIDLELAISRERAAGSAYKVLKEKLQSALIENERLKVDNELLRSELIESKSRFGKTLKQEDCEVRCLLLLHLFDYLCCEN